MVLWSFSLPLAMFLDGMLSTEGVSDRCAAGRNMLQK